MIDKNISAKTIGRLSLYRRLLNNLISQNEKNVYSHRLAEMAGVTAAQVRRDIMALGYCGSPSHGYSILELGKQINAFLDPPQEQHGALIGVGNLGRAILAYFAGRRPKVRIVAAFDKDPDKSDRVILGCRCYAPEQLDSVLHNENISIAVVAVPAQEAQRVAERLVQAGISGILNFAPIPLRVPASVYVEDIDLTMSLDKVAYFARSKD